MIKHIFPTMALVSALLAGEMAYGSPFDFLFRSFSPANEEAAAAEKERMRQAERKRLLALLESSAQRDREAYQRFAVRMENGLIGIFSKTSDVGAVVEDLTSMTSCSELVGLFVLDHFNSTSRAGNRIGLAIGPIYSDRASRCILLERKLLKELAEELNRNTRDFYLSAGLITEVEYEGKDLHLPAITRNLPTSDLLSVSSKTVLGVTFLGLDALMFQSLVGSVKNVLQTGITRMTGAASAGTIAALADGPLPVGDIVGALVGIGGTAWTLADLYQARIVLIRKVRTQIIDDLKNIRTRSRKSAFTHALEMYETHQTHRNEYVQDLLSSDKS